MQELHLGHPWTAPLKAVQNEVLAARRAAAEAGWPGVDTSVPAFFAGRSLLLTGATGFLGRLVMEQVLRSCPDVDKIYVVMRPKRGASVEERLRTAVDNPLFDRLRAEQPGALEAKVRALPGDIAEERLGLSEEDAALVCREVSVVLNVAASVRFVEPIQNAVLTNLRSAREAVALAKAMPKLKVMVHVSTAYSNLHQPVLEEQVYPADHDWRTIIDAAERIPDPETLTFLGPKLLGHQPNSYTFTKALAEQVVNEAGSEIPVVIVRPSIVINTGRDPIPGWIDNLNGFAAFWVIHGMGILATHYSADTSKGHNVVAGDVVAKTILLAAWAKGIGVQQRLPKGYSGVEVVNSVLEETQCLTYDEMQALVEYNREQAPMPGAVRYPTMSFVTSKVKYYLLHVVLHLAFGALLDLLAVLTGGKPRLLGVYRKAEVGKTVTEVFQKKYYPFTSSNQWALQSLLLPGDVKDFCVIDSLNVKDSLEIFTKWSNTILVGIQKYCLRMEFNIEKNKAHVQKLYLIRAGLYGIGLLILLWTVLRLFI